jgi:hypothetical protein
MDYLFALHLLVPCLLLSIPFWPVEYLQYGVYIPLILSFVWIVFNGCPVTKQHKDLSSESFTKEIYKNVIPNITQKDVHHINTFALLLITVVGFRRLVKTSI